MEDREVKTLLEIVYDNKPSTLTRERLLEVVNVYMMVCDNDIILQLFDDPSFFVTKRWFTIEYKEKLIQIPRPQTISEYIHLCKVFCCPLYWTDEMYKKFKGL